MKKAIWAALIAAGLILLVTGPADAQLVGPSGGVPLGLGDGGFPDPTALHQSATAERKLGALTAGRITSGDGGVDILGGVVSGRTGTFTGDVFANTGAAARQTLLGTTSSLPGLWLGANATTPGLTNYSILYDGTQTIFGTPTGTSLLFRIGNAGYGAMSSTLFDVSVLAFNAAAYRTNTNCSDSAGAAACGSAAAGMFVLDAASTTVTVSTTAVTATSEIEVWEDPTEGTRLSVTCNTVNTRQYKVTTRTAATSFVVSAFDFVTGAALAPVTNPGCLSYKIVN